MRKTASERRKVKEIKSKKMSATNTFINNESEFSSFLKISIIVLTLIIIFTITTNIIVSNKNKKSTTTEIQYTKIIVGSILGRKETDYYVLAYQKDDSNLYYYNNYISTYKSKSDHLPVYEVDLSDGFNQSYVAEKSNFKITDISEIRFSKTTLLRIQGGQIIEIYETQEQIDNKLSELSA